MPIVTIKFNLPEENYEFECAIKGMEYRALLDDMDSYLRNKLKYEELSDDTYKALEQAREQLHDN